MRDFFSKTYKWLFPVTAGIAFLALQANAQTTDSLMLAHPEYTASGYLPYQEPDNSVKYTKAPAGYKPFYISHYGRHGSRYHYSADDYKYIYETLAKADTAKALSMTGKYVMAASKLLMDKAASRAGDLTALGAKQHEGIARRMVKNFPEVFNDRATANRAGAKGRKVPAHVDAYASTSGRCILSMSAFLGELRAQKPKVEIHQETGKSLMAFINTFSFDITKNYAETAEYKAESDKLWQNISTRNFEQTLFADTTYVQKNINVSDLYNKMFEISGSLQGMEEDNSLIIFDRLFSKQEKLNRWKAQNAWWYSVLGTCPLTGDDGINTAKPVLKHIMDEADKVIRFDEDPAAATLRFGHDTAILPLAGLMELSIASAQVRDLSKLHEQWTDFKIIPMAANLQMVFYKDPRSSVTSSKPGAVSTKPILVKFLYNELEVTAPINCDQAKLAKNEKCPTAPYYRWDDVREFYSKKIQ
ncbi:MAG: histidine phosphatase family protein [Fibrobacter sp.]|nr:histidine phosphatase family protein [Fibrobacter sp.]